MRDKSKDTLHPYLPTIVQVGSTDEGDWANVFEYLDGFFTLQQVLARYPDGLDPRDVGRMFRRMMVVVGMAWQSDVAHRQLLDRHVLIHPEKRGLALVGLWHSYADKERRKQNAQLPVRGL